MAFPLADAEYVQSRLVTNANVHGPETTRDRRLQRVFVVSLVVIVLAALAVRALPLTSGMPYTSYVDEHFVVRPAATMIADRSWDPGVYYWSPLTMYATAAVSEVLHILPGGGNVEEGARATVDQPITTSIYSSDLLLSGRIVVLGFSIGIVLVSALLAHRLAGRRAAIIAALLTATIPALVTRSAIVIVDTPAAFFASASLLCASFVRDPRRGLVWAAMGGVAAGLGTAAKYSTAFVILAVVTVIVLSTERSLRARLTMTCWSLAACVATAAITAPTLVLRTRAVLGELHRVSVAYEDKATPTYWHEALRGVEVGTFLLVVAMVGGVQLLRSPRTRPVMIGFLAFATALLVSLGRYSFQPFRNVLPLLPIVGVAAAVGIVATIDALGRQVHAGRWTRTGVAVIIGLCLSGVMTVSAWRYYDNTRIDITNSRVEARQWLVDNVEPDDDVLVAREIAFLPSELARIPGEFTLRSLTTTPDPIRTRAFEYVVVGDYETAEKWRRALADRRIAATYGTPGLVTEMNPASFRPNQQVIRVFEESGTQDVRECYPLCG